MRLLWGNDALVKEYYDHFSLNGSDTIIYQTGLGMLGVLFAVIRCRAQLVKVPVRSKCHDCDEFLPRLCSSTSTTVVGHALGPSVSGARSFCAYPYRTDSPQPSIRSLHTSESRHCLGLVLRAIFGLFVRLLLFSCERATRL